MSKTIAELAEEQGVEPFDPDTFEGMSPIGPEEMQEILLNNFKNDLVSKGWTLVRDNKDGGAMVLTGDGIRVVASIHTYKEKDLAPHAIEVPVTEPLDDDVPEGSPWWNVNEDGEVYGEHATEAEARKLLEEFPNDTVVQAKDKDQAERLAWLNEPEAEEAPCSTATSVETPEGGQPTTGSPSPEEPANSAES